MSEGIEMVVEGVVLCDGGKPIASDAGRGSGSLGFALAAKSLRTRMKLSWNKKKNASAERSFAAISKYPNLPFDKQDDPPGEDWEGASVSGNQERPASKAAALDEDGLSSSPDHQQLARSFQSQGDKLAEEGKYREALGKWETALTLIPENAVLHEQKAQVLLEIGDAWGALKAAISASQIPIFFTLSS
ncbi:hypothetical protein NL676_027822 [Syzygium grande]|nr:hypothetical protein NL676_027822 [Syzygium grande]